MGHYLPIPSANVLPQHRPVRVLVSLGNRGDGASGQVGLTWSLSRAANVQTALSRSLDATKRFWPLEVFGVMLPLRPVGFLRRAQRDCGQCGVVLCCDTHHRSLLLVRHLEMINSRSCCPGNNDAAQSD